MRQPLTHDELAAIEARGTSAGPLTGQQVGRDYADLVAEIDRLTGERDRYETALRRIAERCACGPTSHSCSSVIARAALAADGG